MVYGLFLTFSSALQPSFLPTWLPLGPLATSLGAPQSAASSQPSPGNDHPTTMAVLALAAAGLHLMEAVAALVPPQQPPVQPDLGRVVDTPEPGRGSAAHNSWVQLT